jgi:E3 ubiquitin-protein ligase TRIP12
VLSIYLKGGLPRHRKKIIVDHDDILVSPTKMLKSHARSKANLKVEYKEEVSTGLRPTMEFYILISHEFQKLGLGMWRGELSSKAGTDKAHVSRFVVDTNGLFPRSCSSSIDYASFQEVNKRFHSLG